MSFLIIKNVDGGVNIENTSTVKQRFYGHNIYEPELIEDIIYMRKIYSNERDENFKIIDKIADVTSIDDNGTPVAVPATMAELYEILYGFFLTNRNAQLIESLKFKVTSKPLFTETNGDYVVYTGFSRDYEALSSEAKWAVKKMEQDNTESWAGKDTFDEILDDYLTLIYT